MQRINRFKVVNLNSERARNGWAQIHIRSVRAYMGRPKIAYRSRQACMQSAGRFRGAGKSFIAVEIFDCNKIPTCLTGSSEDHTGCRRWLY